MPTVGLHTEGGGHTRTPGLSFPPELEYHHKLIKPFLYRSPPPNPPEKITPGSPHPPELEYHHKLIKPLLYRAIQIPTPHPPENILYATLYRHSYDRSTEAYHRVVSLHISLPMHQLQKRAIPKPKGQAQNYSQKL